MIAMTAFRRMSHDFACLAVTHGGGGATTVSVQSLHIRRLLTGFRIFQGVSVDHAQTIGSTNKLIEPVEAGVSRPNIWSRKRRSGCAPTLNGP